MRSGHGWHQATGALVLAVTTAAACTPCDEHPTASCGAGVVGQIDGFVVTTRTGSDSSDADIQICFELRGGADACSLLETSADDFEDGQIDVFDVDLSFDAGALEGFYLFNGGMAAFGNDEWEIEGVTLEARTLGDTVLLYDEPQLGCGGAQIDEGERWYPAFCSY